MSRFYLRLALIPIALFTVALLLIHAQPYDDHELREFLLPEGCPAPCFMGIRPGVTTVDEAVKLLEASGLAKDIQYDKNAVDWNWDNLKLTWVYSESNGRINLKDDTQLVADIHLNTNISIGEVQLILGKPDMEIVYTPDQVKQNTFYFAAYNQYGLSIQNQIPCDSLEPFRIPIIISISQSTYYSPQNIQVLKDIFDVC